MHRYIYMKIHTDALAYTDMDIYGYTDMHLNVQRYLFTWQYIYGSIVRLLRVNPITDTVELRVNPQP